MNCKQERILKLGSGTNKISKFLNKEVMELLQVYLSYKANKTLGKIKQNKNSLKSIISTFINLKFYGMFPKKFFLPRHRIIGGNNESLCYCSMV